MPLLLDTADPATLADIVRSKISSGSRPFTIAIDGRSGSGKSTLAVKLAAQLATGLKTQIIEGDDFYCGGIDIRSDGPAESSAKCIDLERLRRALLQLRNGESASYQAFDWEAFDGTLSPVVTHVPPSDVIIVEGVYTASPYLKNVDLSILIRISDYTRVDRLLKREGSIGPWELQWHEAEEYYFCHIATPDTFDIIIDAEPSI